MARLLILYGLDGQQRELGEALLFLLEEWMHRAPYPSAVAKISPVTRLPALRVVLRGADGCLLAHDCLTNDRIRMLEAGGHAGAAAPGAAALLEEGPGALGRWVHYLLCALTGGDSEVKGRSEALGGITNRMHAPHRQRGSPIATPTPRACTPRSRCTARFAAST